MRDAKVSYIVRQKFFKTISKIAFSFEPLAPRAISYFLSRELNKLKNQGLFHRVKTKTKRLGKFHYLIEIDLDLTSTQTEYLLKKILIR